MHYLINIPQNIEEYGFSKVLLVRYETIHIKHILTEVFVRKTIDIQKYLDCLNMSLFNYMEIMTNRLRRIYKISREYRNNLNDIVGLPKNKFFPVIELYKGLKNVIVLDFDGVITSKKFKELYDLCIERSKVFICSGNPTIDEDWFLKRYYNLPDRIYSMKGKIKKIKQLIEISKRYDNVFFVDNQDEYLEFAWLFGIKTFKYNNGKISSFSLNSR